MDLIEADREAAEINGRFWALFPTGLSCDEKMDRLVKRWRWVMVAVILFDIAITYTGQPASYWSDPSTVREGNDLFRPIMAQGAWVSILVDLIYIGGALWLATRLPDRLGMALLLALTFGHFFGGSTWICYRYGFGVAGVVVYAAAIAAALTATMPREDRSGNP